MENKQCSNYWWKILEIKIILAKFNLNYVILNCSDADGKTQKCGPSYGPNWPACRTLTTRIMDDFNDEGKFQGWSGEIFCGKKVTRDPRIRFGIWGFDADKWCNKCFMLINNKMNFAKY